MTSWFSSPSDAATRLAGSGYLADPATATTAYLAGALEKSSEGSRRYEGRAKQDLEENRGALQEYEEFCRELGETPADVGLAWLLHQPAVTAPIVGPRTMEQLDGSLHALAVRLDADALGRLDEIFPGYKPAPMEYAW